MIMLIYLKIVRYVKQMNKHITPGTTLFRAQRNLKLVLCNHSVHTWFSQYSVYYHVIFY